MPADKRKRPSRVRYEQAHPTVSCRVSREIYQRLVDTKQQGGKSFADILRVGLGIIETDHETGGFFFDEGYGLGCQEGYEAAVLRFKVIFTCYKCGKSVAVDGKEAKQTVREILEEYGLSHLQCPEKRQSS